MKSSSHKKNKLARDEDIEAWTNPIYRYGRKKTTNDQHEPLQKGVNAGALGVISKNGS